MCRHQKKTEWIRTLFFTLSLCHQEAAASERAAVVYVNEKSGSDVTECLLPSPQQASEQSSITACRSLNYVSKNLRTNSHRTIIIQSDLHLSELVSFANSTSLTILGETNGMEPQQWVLRGQIGSSRGLQFYNITNLNISSIAMSQCEALIQFVSMNRTASLHVHLSTNLYVADILITNLKGTGLVLSDVGGSSVIEDSEFSNSNASGKANLFAGGIHIQFSSNSDPTDLLVKNCQFANNSAPQLFQSASLHNYSTSPRLNSLYGYGNGGGMSVLFTNVSEGANVTVERCTFSDNQAYSGAGLYVHFQDFATGNSLTIDSSRFENNSASMGGGMSIGIGYLSARGSEGNVTHNEVLVRHTTFTGNQGGYGGGTAVFAVHSILFSKYREEMVRFLNCTWVNNTAHYSPAMDISPFQFDRFNQGFLPMPKFSGCNFTENWTIPGKKDQFIHYQSTGVFVVTSFEVTFEGSNVFSGNYYTALRLTSSTVILKPNTSMLFEGNRGIQGGAIAMYGFSGLKGKEGCSLSFFNNSVNKVGGAIYYQPFEQREFIEGKVCFIQYIGERGVGNQTPNFTFTFRNNSAKLGGTAIFSSSFYACFFAHHNSLNTSNLSGFFDNIGHFNFDNDTDDHTSSLATEGNNFVFDGNTASLTTIPGKGLLIPLAVLDEFGHRVDTPLGLELKSLHDSKGPVDRNDYYYFTRNRTRLYGNSGDVINLVFSTDNIREAHYNQITVTLKDCPLGYHFDKSHFSCMCSAENPHTAYKGIPKCNSSLYRAYIQRDYWAGFYNNGEDLELYTAPCAFQHCAINSIPKLHHLLPAEASPVTLNKQMCAKHTEGILCSECSSNYSAFFHSSSSIMCGSEDKCAYGMLFYILSEALPVVILFVLIIHFNISLTAGGVTGFVLFSQMVVVIPVDVKMMLYGQNCNNTQHWFSSMQTGYTIIYSILNFDFFSVDQLSFCLWKSARPMHMLAFKYVTTSFAVVLIFVLVRIANSKWYMRKNRRRRPRSVVHGISAFLVLSFSQCASVTLKLLSYSRITSNLQASTRSVLVTQYGGLPYFKASHLPYATVAIFFLVFLVVLPPVLLLAYPLLLQLSALCGLSEHPIIKTTLRVTCTDRLIPLVDSFQSCFKDRLRFFAGLYFIYKILILTCLSFTNNLDEFFAAFGVIVFIMLVIHSIAQPYKERCHNVMDSCLFLNLGIISSLNMSANYLATFTSFPQMSPEQPPDNIRHLITLTCALMMTLIYMPSVVVVVWGVTLLIRRRRLSHYQNLDSFHDLESREAIDESQPLINEKELYD